MSSLVSRENRANFQIRSYILDPYKLCKDLRTGELTHDVQGVLDGNIDTFLLQALMLPKRRSQLRDNVKTIMT